FGSRVEVKAGGLVQTAEVRANSSFESASDSRVHFGMGEASQADSIIIRWPSGIVDRMGPQAANQEIVVEEGKGVVAKHGATTPNQFPLKLGPPRSKRLPR